jgi:acyl-[acyl-carrier-protein]-phospholipid O-acyltransferase / long-chain-fatty-acid--[acyl-carrier-protein] ligase
MVPLGRVEDIAVKAWPGKAHAVVAVPDARKGEALVLVTDQEGPTRQALLAVAQAEGIPELFVPRVIVTVPKVPLLGTGKTDYPAVRKLADEALSTSKHQGAGADT